MPHTVSMATAHSKETTKLSWSCTQRAQFLSLKTHTHDQYESLCVWAPLYMELMKRCTSDMCCNSLSMEKMCVFLLNKMLLLTCTRLTCIFALRFVTITNLDDCFLQVLRDNNKRVAGPPAASSRGATPRTRGGTKTRAALRTRAPRLFWCCGTHARPSILCG